MIAKSISYFFLFLLAFSGVWGQTFDEDRWLHLSTEGNRISIPNSGTQQVASLVVDVNGDGLDEFMIAESTTAPSLVYYLLKDDCWIRHVVCNDQLPLGTGGAKADIDGDGDLDVVFGEEGGTHVYWWENPFPNLDPNQPWKRRSVKPEGARRHNDMIFGDFDGDGQQELVFWNQGNGVLYYAEIPVNIKTARSWDLQVIFAYYSDGQMEQRAQTPSWKMINEHAGLAKADMDLDGIEDIIGGGHWFKYGGQSFFMHNVIDHAYVYSRCASGQLVAGGRPEVVMVSGYGLGPLVMYTYKDNVWESTILLEEVYNGHSLQIVDFNKDGHLDIFCAEARFSDNIGEKAKCWMFYGNGKGSFTLELLNEGFGHHESRIIDLDGDGKLDILAKPYTWQTPRLDLFLNRKK